MIGIYRLIIGYIRIKISGERPESLINACFSESISIWKITRRKDSIILNISASDYIKIFHLRKKLPIRPRVKILEKHGIPFFIKKHHNRLGVVAGLAIFLLINFLLSSYIWNVEVVGNNRISSKEIVLACEKYGVITGTRASSIDSNVIKQNLPKELDDIAWASINIEGSVATINVSEAETSEDIDTGPSNIVASTDGYIKSLEVSSGIKMVQVGTSVRKGDLLVSGVIPFDSYEKNVKSNGIIIAETYKKASFNINKTVACRKANGRIKTRSVLDIFNIKLPLYLTGVNCESKSYIKEKHLKLFGKKLPIGYIEKNYILTDENYINIDSKQAENIALMMLCDSLNENILSVDSTYCKVNEADNGFRVDIEYVCLENIAVQQPIASNSGS